MAWPVERVMRPLRSAAGRRRPPLGGLLAVLVAAVVLGGIGADAEANGKAHSAACRPTTQPGNPPVVFLPGGMRELAHGTLPSAGLGYRIVGERYRFEGCVYFDLTVGLEQPGQSIPDSGGGGSFTPAQSPGPFSYSAEQVCQPHAGAVVFGLLRDPRDRVLVHSSAGAATAHVVPIPATLHAGGALAYAAVPGTLTAVRVQAGATTVLDDDQLEKPGSCLPGTLLIVP